MTDAAPNAKLRADLREARRRRLHLHIPIDQGRERLLGNGKWKITRVRAISDTCYTGELHDLPRDVQYLWTAIGSDVRYVRLPKTPTDIPLYVRDAVLDTVGDIILDRLK